MYALLIQMGRESRMRLMLELMEGLGLLQSLEAGAREPWKARLALVPKDELLDELAQR